MTGIKPNIPADYAAKWPIEDLREHYAALIVDGKGEYMSREELIANLYGTEFDEFAYD